MGVDETADDQSPVEAQVQKTQRLANQHKALRELRTLDAWHVLDSTVKQAKEKVVRQYANNLLSGSEIPQRQLDYDRGFLNGMQFLLKHPERIESRFNDAVEKLAKLMRQEEAE